MCYIILKLHQTERQSFDTEVTLRIKGEGSKYKLNCFTTRAGFKKNTNFDNPTNTPPPLQFLLLQRKEIKSKLPHGTGANNTTPTSRQGDSRLKINIICKGLYDVIYKIHPDRTLYSLIQTS